MLKTGTKTKWLWDRRIKESHVLDVFLEHENAAISHILQETIPSGILSHPTLKFELHAKHQQQHSCTDSISVACSVFRNHPTFGEISHEDLTQSSVSRTLSACNDRNCLGNPYIYIYYNRCWSRVVIAIVEFWILHCSSSRDDDNQIYHNILTAIRKTVGCRWPALTVCGTDMAAHGEKYQWHSI